MSCTSSDLDINTCSFKKIRVKLKEELRSQDTKCLYALAEVKPKTDLFQTLKKETKLI